MRSVPDLVASHIFFEPQVVEIATETGYPIRQRKITLAIAVDVDILPCPLRNLTARSPSENSRV